MRLKKEVGCHGVKLQLNLAPVDDGVGRCGADRAGDRPCGTRANGIQGDRIKHA